MLPINRPNADVEIAAIGKTTGGFLQVNTTYEPFCDRMMPTDVGVNLPTTGRRPIKSLADIFAQRGISRIDFLNIDIEGQSLNALRSIDFERVDIGVFVVELQGGSHWWHPKLSSQEMARFEGPLGYRCTRLVSTDVELMCWKRSFHPQIEQ